MRRTEGEAALERGAGRAVMADAGGVPRGSGAPRTHKELIALGYVVIFARRPIAPSEQEAGSVPSSELC